MALWECRSCTAAYAPGLPACPQCTATDPIREDEQLRRENEEMAKITVAGGASDAVTGEGIPEPVETTEDETTEVPVAPDANAKKADWVDYAVALGHDRPVIESFTKADIVELVGTRSTSAHADVAAGTGDAGALS